MRISIERLRTVVLAAGALLLIALAVFLVRSAWRNPFKSRDIPKRLGIDIKQESNGVTFRHSFGSHAVFQIHASKVVQLKDNHALLHDVKIELYEQDGSRVDRIEGNEFEYDQQAQIARATGPVEITMMRPSAGQPIGSSKPGAAPVPPASVKAAPAGGAGEIHVKTSGLVFNQNTGVATTDQRVDFAVAEGTGSAIGATYDSEQGHLVLDRQVELNVRRDGDDVHVKAQHGEFDRDDLVCNLRSATADYRNGEATAGEAKILFREDGSAVRVDSSGGFTLATATGGRLAAPQGWLEFDDDNRPKHGHLEGGVTMDSASTSLTGSHQSHGSAPTAELEFGADGNLRHAHLERGVELASDEHSMSQGAPLAVSRKWRSPVADVEFRNAPGNQVEPAWIHGVGGVTVNGESQRANGPMQPSQLAADDLTVDFAPGSAMSDVKGIGHATIEQTTKAGAHQLSSGDRLEAHFLPAASDAATRSDLPVSAQRKSGQGKSSQGKSAQGKSSPDRSSPDDSRSAKPGAGSAAQIESASLEGNVTMSQDPPAKPGEPPGAPMHASAGRADYEGAGEWIHLTETPRIDDAGLQLAADKIDVSQASGDAFAHGNVKATWFGASSTKASRAGSDRHGDPAGAGVTLGGQGPSHVIAAEAQMHQATGEATFHGNARLWQDGNSVAAPVIVLNRQKQTLAATTADRNDPVRVVLVSASASKAAFNGARSDKGKSNVAGDDPSQRNPARPATPSVIRVSGGSLKYSDGEHRAVILGGSVGSVIADTPTARSVSDQVELTLLPPGNHAGKDGAAAQIDRMTASGHVTVSSQGRRGTGTQLVYTGETGEYILTGTPAAPPRIVDPVKGAVTGQALIFRSGDDSVSIEGGRGKTTTETRTPK